MLNKRKGNMYGWIDHTWNCMKGSCYHSCGYCYKLRWGVQKSLRLDESEFRTDLGSGNFIFVGSSTDDFAAGVPSEWITMMLNHCAKFNNRYQVGS